MGVTSSTSLSKLGENAVLKKFVGTASIPDTDSFWKELLTFSYAPPKSIGKSRILEESARPLVELLVKNNPQSGNLRGLVKCLLELTSLLKDESKCESNVTTWQVHNSLLLTKLALKHILENLSEVEAILQLDGAQTVRQITSLEKAPPTSPPTSSSVATIAQATADDRTKSSRPIPANGGPTRSGHASSSSNDHRQHQHSQQLLRVSSPDLNALASQTVGAAGKSEIGGAKGVDSDKGGGGGKPERMSINPDEILSMDTLLSKQLVEHLVSLLAEVPLLPFTYDVHMQGLQLLLVLLSSQMYPHSSSGIFLRYTLTMPKESCYEMVQSLVQHFMSQDPLPPQDFRLQSSGLISSITTGLWSLIVPSRGLLSEPSSPLATASVLLLLVLTHQNSKGYNPYRLALSTFKDHREHKTKEDGEFAINLEKLYVALCQQLNNEQTTLFLYLLLQGNSSFASYVFSRSDIDQLIDPLLQQLYNCGSHSSHHIYMLLIILLIFSQDECFNKSVHEIILPKVTWYKERVLHSISLGSVIVMVLVRTVQVNMAQIRDKYLHTNCLAALANMSAHFHSLHLDAAQKLINLFKLLAKKHQRISERIKSSPNTPSCSPATSPVTPTATPTSPVDIAVDMSQSLESCVADRGIIEEVLLMVLEILNSTLTHNLHNNAHLVYSLLYQREIFEPYRTHPSLMDLIQNIETVIAFFASKLEKKGPGPYSSMFVLETIEVASKTWPRNSLRVFPELRFRYIEEDQPEEFFIPYVWTLVFKASTMYWNNNKIKL